MKKLKALLFLISISSAIYAQNPADKQAESDTLFRTSFLMILNSMPGHFKNVSGQLFEGNNQDEKRYEAKVYLAGMRNFTNETDIVIEKHRSRYYAEYGPYFSTEDVEQKKDMLLVQVKEILSPEWSAEEYKNGLKFNSDTKPARSVYIYHFYGDGSGIFINVIFEVMTD